MKITDEKLSAFLDAELPAQEMVAVRNAIKADESLANRIAALANVDAAVKNSYSKIDARPIPDSVAALLSADQHKKSADIIAFPWWRQVHRGIQQHAVAAACAALFIGFIAGQLPPSTTTASHADDQWMKVAQVLEQGRSGIEKSLNNDESVLPRVTFKSINGQYCRHFNISAKSVASENIACRDTAGWKLVATVYVESINAGSYQPAAGGVLLDSALQQMMDGDFLNANSESTVINNGWVIK